MATRTQIKKNSKKAENIELSISNKTTKIWIPLLLMVPAIIFFFLFLILPLISVFQDSFQTKHGGITANFDKVWRDEDWYYSMGNSFLYAIISLPISMIISVVISVMIVNVSRKKLKNGLQSLFFLPYVTSAVAVSIVFANLFSSTGIINSLFGLDIGWLLTEAQKGPWGLVVMIIYGIWTGLAFKILILTTAIMSIDKRLYDAASIDGANQKRQFFSITLPGIESTMWYLFTIGLIGSIKVFPLALFSSNTGSAIENGPTMLIYVYHYISQGKYGLAGASSLSLVMVILVFNFVVRRLFAIIRYIIAKRKSNVEYKKMERLDDRLRAIRIKDGSHVNEILKNNKGVGS